jgi:hypothetical protein
VVRCSKEALLGIELALSTIARDGTGEEARAEILHRWGRAGLVSLAYAIVGAQSFPTFKYAIGRGNTCVRVTIGNETSVKVFGLPLLYGRSRGWHRLCRIACVH